MTDGSFDITSQGTFLDITPTVRIPVGELSFSYARSSGAGGQNVNKVNSKVLLSFDIERTESLSDEEKRRIHQKLSGRISHKGILKVVCMRHRSQFANRREAVDRLVKLLQNALSREKKRFTTKIPPASRRKRLSQKKHRGLIKKGRKIDFGDQD